MKNIDYKEAMHLAEDSFYEYKDDEGYSIGQSLAAALEDCILMMKKNKVMYNVVIIALSRIGMKYLILPDYLYERVLVILDNFPEDLEPNFAEEYNNMVNEIKIILEGKKFEIIKDEIYKARVNMILSNNIS
ncbi:MULTISPECIES: hypothetical protein [unclassified Clostridium]|uniref:hypothetical protein n=1 Tax=unclassified Clostridium TaxID=2614128 RepID=UPI0025C0A8E9|nr:MULTISPECIES: hypothetical protein [unclassified Clostridium]